MIFSHVKITCYFHMWRYQVFARKLTFYFIGVYIIKGLIIWDDEVIWQVSQADMEALTKGKQGFASCISLGPFYMEKSYPWQRGHSPSQATLSASTFHTVPYKRWWTVHMRDKKSAPLEEWPSSWVTPLARPTFLRINTFALPAV